MLLNEASGGASITGLLFRAENPLLPMLAQTNPYRSH